VVQAGREARTDARRNLATGRENTARGGRKPPPFFTRPRTPVASFLTACYNVCQMIKLTVLPRTAPGKWSAGLLAGLVLFLALLLILVAAGQRGGDTFFSNLALAIPGLLAGTCGIAAFITGTIAIIKSQERAILVFLATIVGLFVLVFCLGEFLSPH
jgi:hypothetical protein